MDKKRLQRQSVLPLFERNRLEIREQWTETN